MRIPVPRRSESPAGRLFRRLAAPLLVGLLAAAGLEASAVVYLPLDRMAVAADQIFRGEVVGVRSQLSARRTSIHTFVTIEVDDWLKGGRGGSFLTLRVLGGEAEGYRLVVAGAPEFRVGEEVLVFTEGGAGRVPSVFGLASGKFTVERDETAGEPMLHRSLAALTLRTRDGDPLPAQGERPRGRATLAEVERIVRGALAGR